MESKARSFLSRAQDSHLAVAPEWSYNVEWVSEHEKLFAEDSPLFVLGCRPVRIGDMENIVSELRDEFEVISESVPDTSNKEFVTPTVVPLRADALGGVDSRGVVIQYKNYPMSEGVNPNEGDNLATGSRIHEIIPNRGPRVVVWTCSDLLDSDLWDIVKGRARDGNIVVHPQCNPGPFNQAWIDFRSKIFDNKNDVTYVCANWGDVTADEDLGEAQWGYSGVYTKVYDEWSSLENYDQTHKNGGVLGVDDNSHTEYVWTLVNDGVSRLSVCREGSGSAPSQEGPPKPQIRDAWTWDGGEYAESPDGVSTCGCKRCHHCDCATCSHCRRPEREDRLPESPRGAELVAAVTLWQLDVDKVRSLDKRWNVPLVALKNHRAGRQEKLGHSFISHGHRYGDDTIYNTDKVLSTFDIATNESGYSIEPVKKCEPVELPINATATDSLDISLSRLDDPTHSKERQWMADIVKWKKRREGHYFKPLVLTVSASGSTLKMPDGLEDVTNTIGDPEDVTAMSLPVELVEVD